MLSLDLRALVVLMNTSLLAGCLPSYSFRISLGCCGIIGLKGQSYTVLADGVVSVAECAEV